MAETSFLKKDWTKLLWVLVLVGGIGAAVWFGNEYCEHCMFEPPVGIAGGGITGISTDIKPAKEEGSGTGWVWLIVLLAVVLLVAKIGHSSFGKIKKSKAKKKKAAEEAKKSYFTGHVKERDPNAGGGLFGLSNGLPGVKVSVLTAGGTCVTYAISHDDGTYQTERIPSKDYTLLFHKDGFDDKRIRETLNEMNVSTDVIDVTLDKTAGAPPAPAVTTGTIEGNVKQKHGGPINSEDHGVSIHFKDSHNHNCGGTTTDDVGHYSMPGLQPEKYTVTGTADGFLGGKRTGRSILGADETKTVDLKLLKKLELEITAVAIAADGSTATLRYTIKNESGENRTAADLVVYHPTGTEERKNINKTVGYRSGRNYISSTVEIQMGTPPYEVSAWIETGGVEQSNVPSVEFVEAPAPPSREPEQRRTGLRMVPFRPTLKENQKKLKIKFYIKNNSGGELEDQVLCLTYPRGTPLKVPDENETILTVGDLRDDEEKRVTHKFELKENVAPGEYDTILIGKVRRRNPV